MIKDRSLKIKLLKYYIKKFWYPQMEVDVLSKQRISNNRKVITDIDVLGMYTDVTGNFKSILGDCKTLKGVSPISRALWMKGLMEYFEAEKGIILLSKEIEKEHQLTATFLDIQLLSEKDFDVYSKHTSDSTTPFESALGEGDAWDSFFEIEKKFPRLANLIEFSKSAFWNNFNNGTRLRNGIYNLRIAKGELNPINPLHLSVVLNHFSLIAIALNDIINKTFNRYLLPSSKDELADDLKVIIYGGIENYEFRNDLRKRYIGPKVEDKDLSLPEWDMFIEFIRSTLENPLSMNYLALFYKELAYEYLTPGKVFNYSQLIAAKDKYTTTYALKLSEYLIKASGLPSEFNDILNKKYLNLSR